MSNRPDLDSHPLYLFLRSESEQIMNDAAPAAIVDEKAAAAAAQEALKQRIQAKYDNSITVMPASFFFKTQEVIDPVTKKPEIEIKDGKEVKKTRRRPTVNLLLPVQSVEGIVNILSNGDTEQGKKDLALLLDVVQEAQIQRARELVNEDENISQENFPMEKISWAEIANMPRGERRGGGISKETWEDFGKDYLAVMPEVLSKPVETIEKHVSILLNKLNLVRDRKEVLELMRSNLALYLTKSSNAENFQECVEFLEKKAKNFLEFDTSQYLQNL